MTPENSVIENSVKDGKLNAALESLKAARELQKLRRSHGVDRIHLLVDDVEGDWLEEWGDDEILDSEEFQDKLNFLAATARREEFQKEIQRIEERIAETDQEIQEFSDKLRQHLERINQDVPVILPVQHSPRNSIENLPESICGIIEKTNTIITLNKLISLPPTAEYYCKVGNREFFLTQYEHAIEFYNKALECDPTHPEVWNNRGVLLGKLDCHEEALFSFDKTIELKSDVYYAWDNRGKVLDELGRYEEALSSYNKAIELKPDYADAWTHRGFSLNEQGQYESALVSHSTAINLAPNDANAWFNRACTYGLMKEVDKAVEDLREAINLDPALFEKAKIDSDFDAIRNDDRFQQLLASENEN